MATRSDLSSRIEDQIRWMLHVLHIESDVRCLTESLGKVRANGGAAKAGLLWMGEVTIDGVPYTVGSRVGIPNLKRILIEDHREEDGQPVDFLVVPKPLKRVLTSVGEDA